MDVRRMKNVFLFVAFAMFVVPVSLPAAVEATEVAGGRTASLAGGTAHTLALAENGSIWAWGSNGSGQLGDGTFDSRSTPVQVSSLTDAVAVAAGGDHSLALKRDGTVWAWGWNLYGQLGDGTSVNRNSPVQVQGLADVVAVAAGDFHSLALKRDGTVWVWGDNFYGQLGNGTTRTA